MGFNKAMSDLSVDAMKICLTNVALERPSLSQSFDLCFFRNFRITLEMAMNLKGLNPLRKSRLIVLINNDTFGFSPTVNNFVAIALKVLFRFDCVELGSRIRFASCKFHSQ